MDLNLLNTTGNILIISIFLILEFSLMIMNLKDRAEYQRKWDNHLLTIARGRVLFIEHLIWMIIYSGGIYTMIAYAQSPHWREHIMSFLILVAVGRMNAYNFVIKKNRKKAQVKMEI